MTLEDAARAARQRADTSTDPGLHALANALDAALRAESDRLLRDALIAEPDPEHAPPPWSQVSRPGDAEGPIPF